MAGFKDIIGQENIKEHMQNAIQMDKVSHAYIIQGELGAGKEFIAKVFAKTIQCERSKKEPCEECRSCKQMDGRNQPDVIWVTHEKPNSIGVEDIRGQINNDIGIKPYYGPKKIYIIRTNRLMCFPTTSGLDIVLCQKSFVRLLHLIIRGFQLFYPRQGTILPNGMAQVILQDI